LASQHKSQFLANMSHELMNLGYNIRRLVQLGRVAAAPA
jgi:signal transduction histidine kinase